MITQPRTDGLIHMGGEIKSKTEESTQITMTLSNLKVLKTCFHDPMVHVGILNQETLISNKH